MSAGLVLWLPLLAFLALGAVAFQLAWSRPVPERARRRVAALVLAAVSAPFLLALSGLWMVYRAYTTADASEKASLLAAGIAEAMNCFVFGLVLSGGILLAFAFGAAARRLVKR